ncbi:MAG: DNA polymerase IV [Clostridia bacterium]|nr:DNA polymerase IV [Clostridia bacterium]MBQ9322854.1 DNA polymerase IV [Clostridia bacterium]MBR0422334.1 DNA polymerase IV [Clostridia bacterium]
MWRPENVHLDPGFLPEDRIILHADCNSYFASVESIDHPEWKLVPMAVCGDPELRHGIILAKNELAKAYHIQTAETIYSAKKKCPDLLLVPAHHEKYKAVCERINAIYEGYTDLVERFSIDESFLDVTGSRHLFGSGKEIADELRRRIREEIGVTISVGVSFNKTFAKMGSDYKKPDATTVISRENYKELLWSLPIGELLFVGKSGASVLKDHGILTIGDLAQADPASISSFFGKTGVHLQQAARGEDLSPVLPTGYEEQPKSISHNVTFDHDLMDPAEVLAGLTLISDQVGTRLRRKKLFASVVQIQIKDTNLKVINRQKQLAQYTCSTRLIRDTAVRLLRENWPEGMPIRMLSVGVTGLSLDGSQQLDLFMDTAKAEKAQRLDEAVDSIRAKYGKQSITFGRTMDT